MNYGRLFHICRKVIRALLDFITPRHILFRSFRSLVLPVFSVSGNFLTYVKKSYKQWNLTRHYLFFNYWFFLFDSTTLQHFTDTLDFLLDLRGPHWPHLYLEQSWETICAVFYQTTGHKFMVVKPSKELEEQEIT